MKQLFTALALAAVAATLSAQAPAPDAATGEIIIRDIPRQQPATPEPERQSAPRAAGRKSIKTAFLMSLALPGAGEYYAGEQRHAVGFFTAEGLIWSFALFSKFQGEMWKRDYRNYAAQKAGSNFSRENDEYYRDIYEYPNSDWYNEDQWRQAREHYPDDPAAQAAWVSGRLYTAADAWRWQADGEWHSYRSLRIKSRSALQRISYAAGGALLNRVLSSVNAARLTRRHNRRPDARASAVNWRLDAARNGDNLTFRLAGEF